MLSSYVDVADRGDAPGSGEAWFRFSFLAPAAVSFSTPLLLSSFFLSFLWLGEVVGHQVAVRRWGER